MQLYSALSGKFLIYITQIHIDKISLVMSQQNITDITTLSLDYFENPETNHEIINVVKDINTLSGYFWEIISSVSVFIQLISSSIILGNYNVWMPVILILSCIPNFAIDRFYANKLYYWNRGNISSTRKLNYTYDVLTSKIYYKDIKLNSAIQYLKNKYNELWNICYNEKHQIIKLQFLLSVVTLLLPNIITIVYASNIINNIIQNQNTIGDFSYYIGIMGSITNNTFSIIALISKIYSNKVKINYYKNFKSWVNNSLRKNVDGLIKIKNIYSIEFKNVSFKYPNSDNIVLNNLSFKIMCNQSTCLIGENGAGKSTIVKLLLGFYMPSSGEIYINNINLNKIDFQSYYKLISVMFQDYVLYAYSLKDNFKMSDMCSEFSEEKAKAALLFSNSYTFFDDWPNGYDTVLTKNFDLQGIELSKGQWQKIALSKFFYKDSDLLLMDEPASSIDIVSEDIIYKNLIQCRKNKILFMISHSLGNAHCFDQIIFLKDKKICEIGSYIDLMRKRGEFYNLYIIQREKYK